MKASDSVAAVALLVSLIALFIASIQLLQQLFGTAEGYRRCAPSVMGPWASTRHRRWNRTEFRFEVQYMTPHFVLLPSDARDRDWKNIRRAYGSTFSLLNIPKHPARSLDQPSLFKQIGVHVSKLLGTLPGILKWAFAVPIRWWPSRRTYGAPSINTILNIVENTVHLYAEIDDNGTASNESTQVERKVTDSTLRQPQQAPTQDAEKQSIMMSFDSSQSSQGLSEPRNELRVAWLQLLGALHGTYRSYYAADKMPQTPDETNRTDAAIAVRKWNWDFMPSDLLRPLATSTLSNVILFALRLNMRWQKLDLKTGIFLADGNGYSVSSAEVRGLGIVFRFSVDGRRDGEYKVIPSKAVDKMMFGIVSGCPILVKGKDFPLVDRAGHVESNPPESLLRDIGIDDWRKRGDIVHKSWQEPHNDLVVLLSRFLPLPNCPVLYHSFSAWTTDPILSPLHFFEGRLAFVEKLQDRIKAASDHSAINSLKAVVYCFDQLNQNQKNDFFDRWELSAIESSDDQENDQRKLGLSKECQDIFDWTSAWFQGQSTKEWPQDVLLMHRKVDNVRETEKSKDHVRSKHDWTTLNEGRTRYVDLVAGHTILSFHAVSHVVANGHERTEGALASEARRKKHREMFKYNPGTVSTHIQYHIATQYVRYLKHDTYGVSKHLRSKGVDWDEEEIEAAWWVMILRGIVWDMATMGDRNYSGRQGIWNGERVPSFYYDMKTPVWIT